MDRKRLQRQLRRVARLGRYQREITRRLKTLCDSLQVTDQELELLVRESDGYLLVCDARDEKKHITLSDADEHAKARARKREEQRLAASKKARDERAAQVKVEKEERKQHKIKKNKEQLLEMAQMFKAAGINPFEAASNVPS